MQGEPVVAVKVAEVCPARTVTEGGTERLLSPLLRETTAPPEGAAAFRVTVPVEDCPPVTELGLKLRLCTNTEGPAVMVRVAVCAGPRPEAVMIACTVLATVEVVAVKFWVETPGPKVRLAGTWALALLLLRLTPTPLQGAPRVRVTVPVEELPPTTVLGLREMVEIKVLPPTALMVRVACTEAPP